MHFYLVKESDCFLSYLLTKKLEIVYHWIVLLEYYACEVIHDHHTTKYLILRAALDHLSLLKEYHQFLAIESIYRSHSLGFPLAMEDVSVHNLDFIDEPECYSFFDLGPIKLVHSPLNFK